MQQRPRGLQIRIKKQTKMQKCKSNFKNKMKSNCSPTGQRPVARVGLGQLKSKGAKAE